MKYLFACLLALTLGAFLSSGVWGGNSDTRESRFAVYSHGFRIGEATAVCSLAGNGDSAIYTFSNTTKVTANFLVHSYLLDNHEDAVVGKGGTLRYSRTVKENGNAVTVEGALENNAFRLKVTEQNTSRVLSIPRERYDYTAVECPEIHMKREGEMMTVRLLDFEALEVVTRHYTWVRSEALHVGGKTYTFRVVDFEDKNKKCRRWIRVDDVGVMIARQEGSGKKGAYSVKLVEYKSPLI
ncbi:MAG: hypothetical protein HXX11_14045 [Desulfuromonadales bacterium]|nr:hypothetical protein [Desulfuromonadales bacterium]